MRRIAIFLCVFLGAVVLTPMDGYGLPQGPFEECPSGYLNGVVNNCAMPHACQGREVQNQVYVVNGKCITIGTCQGMCPDDYHEVRKTCDTDDGGIVYYICEPSKVVCRAGYYYSGSECKSCEAGYYCRGGSFSKNGGIQGRNKCPAGTYGATTGLTSATCSGKCAAGTYSTEGATQCTACSVGTYSAGGTGSCTSCPMGKYADKEGQSSCTSCPAGTYGATTGLKSSECSGKCSAGTYSPAGATKCTDCAAGTYSDKDGQSSCTPCPVRTYSSAVRATKCTDCDAGPKGTTPTTSGTGKTSVKDCYISSDAKWTFENNKGGGTRAFSSNCSHK